eukprot:TRINITY_DN2468_c0_g1_i21.p1 TRINITY_DN2468_c0_g1~~TRINITY_DN2468_c0_g1_i21.p1  ORF type:complete len:229 (+),score=44.21 TRINITY_DN2468_c0_g1_i21:49-687(+)
MRAALLAALAVCAAEGTAPSPHSSGTTSHKVSDTASVHSYYSNSQEWVISCTPGSTVFVTVTQLSGDLTASGRWLVGALSMYLGQRTVPCPSTGETILTYYPSSDYNQPLVMKWAPSWGTPESKGMSPLLIALVATAGVLVLVGLTVAVYCGCSGKSADPNAYSSNVQVEGYADVVHTGGFGGLQDSSSPPVGQQPMCEMNEQMPVAEIAPL